MSKKRMPEHVAEAVIERSGGKCEAMGTFFCDGPAQQLHHRRMRSQGGKHTVQNLLALCASCHSWVHRHPKESYRLGWLVRSVKDPLEVPVQYRGLTSHLDAEGGVTWVGN